MGVDARGSEPKAGDESEVPVTQAPLEVGSVCGSNAAESVASVAGLSFPSLDGAICSVLRSEQLQALSLVHGPMTDLGHVHRGGRERLSWDRIC